MMEDVSMSWTSQRTNGDFAHQASTQKHTVMHDGVLLERSIESHRLDFATQYTNIVLSGRRSLVIQCL